MHERATHDDSRAHCRPETSLQQAQPAAVLTRMLNELGITTFGELDALDVEQLTQQRGLSQTRLSGLRLLQGRVRLMLGRPLPDVAAPTNGRKRLGLRPEDSTLMRWLGLETVEAVASLDLDALATRPGVRVNRLRQVALLKLRAQEALTGGRVPLLNGVMIETGRRLRASGLTSWEAVSAWMAAPPTPARCIFSPAQLREIAHTLYLLPARLTHTQHDDRSWEVLSPRLTRTACRLLAERGCQTVDDVRQLVARWDRAQRSALPDQYSAALHALDRLPPLPTSAGALLEHLLASLAPEVRGTLEGRYVHAESLEALRGHMTHQAVGERINTAIRLLHDRFPGLLATLAGPVVAAFDEAGILEAESVRAFGLTVPQAVLLLRIMGRDPYLASLRMSVDQRPRWHGHLPHASSTFEPDHPCNAITKLDVTALNRRMATLRSTLRALERRRIDRSHLVQLWDESTGLAVPDATVWAWVEVLMGRPVGVDGLELFDEDADL